MNVNAPQQPSTGRADLRSMNYLSFETGPHVHRRRATLPSLIISPQDAAALHRMWSSTDLAPISGSEKSPSQGIPSPSIGLAISSGGANPNRRSRSAGALHEMARRQEMNMQMRRRSSEIKYWRASKIDSAQDEQPLSRKSSPAPSSKASSFAPAQTEVSDALADTGSSIHDFQLQSFNFGSAATDPSTPEKPASITEHQLSQLESTTQRLPTSLQDVTLQPEPPREREFALKPAPRTQTSQSTLTASAQNGLGLQSEDSTPQRTSSLRFFTQPRPAPSPSPSKTSHQHSYFPTSPPMAASLAIPRSTSLTQHPPYPEAHSSTHSAPQNPAAELTPLYNALRYERQVRKGLEVQVAQLRADVVDLSALVAEMRGSVRASSPSVFKNRKKGFSAVTNGESSRFSGYDSDGEEERDEEGVE